MSTTSLILLILAAGSLLVFLADAAVKAAAAKNPTRTQAFRLQFFYLGLAVGFSIGAVIFR